MQTIQVLCGAGFTVNVGFANIRSAAYRSAGDVTVVGTFTEERANVYDDYALLRLGAVAAVEEWWSRNPGHSGSQLHLGSDEDASLRLAADAGFVLGRCSWCRDGEIRDIGERLCSDCRRSQCECGALPGGNHYDDCE